MKEAMWLWCLAEIKVVERVADSIPFCCYYSLVAAKDDVHWRY